MQWRLNVLTAIQRFIFSLCTGQSYYLNVHTKESQWDVPEKPAEPVSSAGPEQVQCSHLLVKHQMSRRPSSWREETITRSPEEALQLVKCKFYYSCVKFICYINYHPFFSGQFYLIRNKIKGSLLITVRPKILSPLQVRVEVIVFLSNVFLSN